MGPCLQNHQLRPKAELSFSVNAEFGNRFFVGPKNLASGFTENTGPLCGRARRQPLISFLTPYVLSGEVTKAQVPAREASPQLLEA